MSQNPPGGPNVFRHAEHYPDAFADVASTRMPDNIPGVLQFAEVLYYRNPIYREALRRVVAYFLTGFEIVGDDIDSDEKEKQADYLVRTGARPALFDVGEEWMGYGNVFSSVYFPFERRLRCGSCSFEAPAEAMRLDDRYNLQFKGYQFDATCMQCRRRTTWSVRDSRAGEEDLARLNCWRVHDIEIDYEETSRDTEFFWRIPSDVRQKIKRGHLFDCVRSEDALIRAVKDQKDIRFAPGVIKHVRDNVLSGVRTYGWGLPRAFTCFPQAWYLQMLLRYNEAIMLDYLIPFRALTPEAGPGGTDPSSLGDMARWTAAVMRAVKRRRQFPDEWAVLPSPVKYQVLGGEAVKLAPAELITQATEALLAGMGIPVELYRGTLTVQAAGPALRLMESHWTEFSAVINDVLAWYRDTVGRRLGWAEAEARLLPVTHADDLDIKALKAQYVAQGLMSPSSGMKMVGADYRDEQRRALEDQRYVAELEQEMQEEMEGSEIQRQSVGQPIMPPGQPGQPGAPESGGAAQAMTAGQPMPQNIPTTPEEVMARAQEEATRLLSLPDTQRRSELIQLKKQDPQLHAAVTQSLADLRYQARMQGGEMVMGGQKAASLAEKVAAAKSRLRSRVPFPAIATSKTRKASDRVVVRFNRPQDGPWKRDDGTHEDVRSRKGVDVVRIRQDRPRQAS